MAFLRIFVDRLGRVSESGTITLMTSEQQAEWLMQHPCIGCGQVIDARVDACELVEWSDGQRYQYHVTCPDCLLDDPPWPIP